MAHKIYGSFFFTKLLKKGKRRKRYLTPFPQNIDLKTYAKYILRDGTNEEKRELTGCFKSKVVITKKVVTITE